MGWVIRLPLESLLRLLRKASVFLFKCMLALAAVALVFMVSGMVLSSLMFSFRQTSLSVPPLGGVTGDGIIDLF
jgi:hypothetical protein